jgi:aryl-alcohol dehydrogenase-like predicted oxidoreductase
MTSGTITAESAGTWQLGDLTVNRIGFGAMRLAGRVAFDAGGLRDRDRSAEVLRQAVDLGVNHIDTAAFYFSALRSANEIINRALRPYPEDLVLVSKVGPGREPNGDWLPWARPEQLRGQVEENLRQLGRDHLDVVNLRTFGRGPIGEHVGALTELRDAGLVRHIGLSNVGLDQIAEAQEITPVVCVQNRYALDSRPDDGDDVLDACRDQGIAFVPFFAIAGAGREQGPGQTEHDVVTEIAGAHDATPAQVRLAWTLHRGPHVLAIPGTGDPAHLVENVGAGALRLTEDEVTRLSAL